MASLGTLAVNIVARTEKFTAGITKSIKTMGTFNAGMSKSTKLVGGFVGALGASAAGYMSTRAFLTIADDLDALGEQSERLGVTAQKLQELRYAGQMTGVETGLLDKSVGRLNLNIAKAATGTGAGAKALDELGITVKDLNALAPDAQFRAIAEAMGSVESQSDKARIATALFGKEGRTLLPTLDLGAQGLSKMAAESRKLQGVLTDTDIAKVAELNDAIDRLKLAAGGAGNEIVISAAPSLTAAAEGMAEALQGMKSFKMPDNVITRNVGAAAGAAHDSLAGMYYRNFFGGADDNAAGALTVEEQIAANKRVSADKFRTSTDPTVAFNRMVSDAARGNELRYGKAFNDNTVGVASNAIGAGAKGLLDLAGSFKTQSEAMRKTTLGRSAAGLNPLTGLAPIQMSDARREYMAGRGSGQLGIDDQKAPAVAPRRELTARTAGDIDTYAAARRNMGNNQKTQVDLLTRIAKATESASKTKPTTPAVYTLAGVG